jgi:tetratricopeptide (TPR) repeat protein
MRTATRISVAAVAALWAALWAISAAAQDSNARACKGEGDVTLDQRITACTALISAGNLAGEVLADAFNNRGGAHYYKSEFNRALSDYGQAIKLNPKSPSAFNNRCWTSAVTGRLQQAVDDCTESLRLEPNVANTHENRGFAFLKMGQFDRALADYEIALRLDPNRADNHYGRGLARLKKGDPGGEADVAKAKAMSPHIAEEFASYGIK